MKRMDSPHSRSAFARSSAYGATPLAGKVDSFDDFGGGRGKSELRFDAIHDAWLPVGCGVESPCPNTRERR
jgi:hypothetical protein